jgi:hypothetical protein
MLDEVVDKSRSKEIAATNSFIGKVSKFFVHT